MPKSPCLLTCRALSLPAVVLALGLLPLHPALGQVNPVNLDSDKGTREGSPLDDLPDHIRLLDIRLPEGGQPGRADWSPDGQRMVITDAPIGDAWEYDLRTGALRNLTGTFLAGVMRPHYLSNGDLILCALTERSEGEPESDRFNGELFVLRRPLGTHAPVALGEGCWEGIAVSKSPASTRIAWNRSTIDFTAFPDVFVEALAGESEVLTGRIVYAEDGTPTLTDKEVVLDKRDVSPDTPAVEAQDFRTLDDSDGDPDDELIFTAYFHKGGQVLGLNLDTREITDYAPDSVVYEEAEGIDPAGRYVMVEQDLTVTLFPGMVDIWRLPLDGSGEFERLTTFSHYEGYGANNPVVSPDGKQMAFGLKIEGEEGESDGVLVMDLEAATAPEEPQEPPETNAAAAPAGPAGARLPATGGPIGFPVAAAVLLLLAALARPRRTTQGDC
jgi:hypothetical protein